MIEPKYAPGDTVSVRVRVKEVIIGKEAVSYGIESPREGLEVPMYLSRIEERDVIAREGGE